MHWDSIFNVGIHMVSNYTVQKHKQNVKYESNVG